MEHPEGTVTLKDDDQGNLVLSIPSKGLFREMASYPLGKGKLNSIKKLHKNLKENGVELFVNVEDKNVLKLGQDDSPYINYLYLAGNYISGLGGKKDKP